MKKIILSLGVIVAVAVGAIGTTRSFFSDTETSTGNTFTAGAIDLRIDSQCSYNDASSTECGTWELKDLIPGADKFFNFSDIKPGDSGENTISLHVVNNDAWVCADITNLTSLENGRNEPEAQVDESDDVGELDDEINWVIWRDDGEGGGVAGDNVQNGTESTLLFGPLASTTLSLYDSTTGTSMSASSTTYLGMAWNLPNESGNETQTDSLTADIGFRVIQARNNNSFRCVELPN